MDPNENANVVELIEAVAGTGWIGDLEELRSGTTDKLPND